MQIEKIQIRIAQLRRRWVDIFAVLSILLAITIACCWAIGSKVGDPFSYRFSRPFWFADVTILDRTTVLRFVQNKRSAYFERSRAFAFSPLSRTGYEWHGFAGFHSRVFGEDNRTVEQDQRMVFVPTLTLIVVFLLPPTIWIAVRLRRRRSLGEFACLTCGYDLRATRERCPECGAVVSREIRDF